ncbi:hypothetical protein ACZ90_14300 [Streptomyces albus subsp. albus]|nr:hypothetical protein ACZ90_14300 [Streptomyces albus subsp. albus]
MSGAVNSSWPTTDLDPLRRLKVIAATAKHATFAERYYEVPLDRLWAVASDLERELPRLVPGVRSFTVLDSVGDRLSARAVSVLGHREHFDVVLRPGWCLMQSRVLASGMAAVAEGDGTRFAFFSSLRLPGGRLLNRMRLVRAEARTGRLFDRLEQRIAARSLPGAAEGQPGPEEP